MTVNRALRELQLEGLVDRVQGVGTFAAQLHRVCRHRSSFAIFTKRSSRAGMRTTLRCISREEQAGAQAAQRLGVAPGARVFIR